MCEPKRRGLIDLVVSGCCRLAAAPDTTGHSSSVVVTLFPRRYQYCRCVGYRRHMACPCGAEGRACDSDRSTASPPTLTTTPSGSPSPISSLVASSTATSPARASLLPRSASPAATAGRPPRPSPARCRRRPLSVCLQQEPLPLNPRTSSVRGQLLVSSLPGHAAPAGRGRLVHLRRVCPADCCPLRAGCAGAPALRSTEPSVVRVPGRLPADGSQC